eukprot:4462408-Pleurochrysis_carterae.AAC.1
MTASFAMAIRGSRKSERSCLVLVRASAHHQRLALGCLQLARGRHARLLWRRVAEGAGGGGRGSHGQRNLNCAEEGGKSPAGGKAQRAQTGRERSTTLVSDGLDDVCHECVPLDSATPVGELAHWALLLLRDPAVVLNALAAVRMVARERARRVNRV